MIIELTDEEAKLLAYIILEFMDSPGINDSNSYTVGVLYGKAIGLKDDPIKTEDDGFMVKQFNETKYQYMDKMMRPGKGDTNEG